MAVLIPIPAQIEAVKREIQAQIDAQPDSPPDFNMDAWLQEWLQRPQPALGGRKSAELLSTEEGIESVGRALGSTVSGSYQ